MNDQNNQSNETQESTDQQESAEQEVSLGGVAGFIIFVIAIFYFFNPLSWFTTNIPEIEMSAELADYLDIRDCDIEIMSLNCTVHWKNEHNPMPMSAAAAIAFDEAGVRLGVWSFPQNKIWMNQSSKETVFFFQGDFDDVKRVEVVWK